MFIAHVYKWPAIVVVVVVCVRCCIRLSVRYNILCNICIYCELHVVGDSLYMSLCNVILFVGWFLFGRANNNHPSPSHIHTPYSLVCILAFLTGIRMAMISEPSQRLHSLRYILLHSFPDQFFLHLVPGINYLFKRNQALSRSLFTNFQTITYAEYKCCSQYEQ